MVKQFHIYNLVETMKYCKRGYFPWGEISQKIWQDLSRGGKFHDTIHISLIKSYNNIMGFIFTWENF